VSHCELSDRVDEHCDMSLVTGRLRHTGLRPADDMTSAADQTELAVVSRDELMTVADNSVAGILLIDLYVLVFTPSLKNSYLT